MLHLFQPTLDIEYISTSTWAENVEWLTSTSLVMVPDSLSLFLPELNSSHSNLFFLAQGDSRTSFYKDITNNIKDQFNFLLLYKIVFIEFSIPRHPLQTSKCHNIVFTFLTNVTFYKRQTCKQQFSPMWLLCLLWSSQTGWCGYPPISMCCNK